ncbi:MAG TPA: sigma-70 family RNA polymerase sigma factor [Gemmataceae bacterium]|jgi:RNA polymerase sigma factor (sigma-70 family)
MNELHPHEQAKTSHMSNCKHANGEAASRGAFPPQLPDLIGRIMRSAGDVEDVIQEAMLEAWRTCPRAWWREEDGQLHRWLTVAALHFAIDDVRRRKREAAQSLDAVQEQPADPRDEKAANLEHRERFGAYLNAWMEELRARHPLTYRLLHGHLIEGRLVKQLAAEEGLSANAASGRIRWAKAWLRTRAANLLKDEAESP